MTRNQISAINGLSKGRFYQRAMHLAAEFNDECETATTLAEMLADELGVDLDKTSVLWDIALEAKEHLGTP